MSSPINGGDLDVEWVSMLLVDSMWHVRPYGFRHYLR